VGLRGDLLGCIRGSLRRRPSHFVGMAVDAGISAMLMSVTD
jgi:hypothetical protein